MLLMYIVTPAAASASLHSEADSFAATPLSGCPGITVPVCWDSGCLGYDASSCPSDCAYNSTLQRCVGVQSCVTRSCSDHGLCVLEGSATTGSCACLPSYYGADCSLRCTQEGCAATYGVAGLECSAEGACRCPGHFDNLLKGCSVCEDGWFGKLCDMACECGGHGTCGRVDGVCSCFADAERGFWDGAACGQCNPAYMGDTCTTPNAFFTELPAGVMEVHFESAAADVAEEAMTLQWVGGRRLVLSRGADISCNDVAAANVSTGGSPVVGASRPLYAAPRVVRSSTVFGNQTVALLAAGFGTDGSAFGVSVMHCTANTGADACSCALMADTTLSGVSLAGSGGGDEVAVVAAQLTEAWGWAVLLSTGAVVLQRRPDAPRFLPAGVTPTSLHVDAATGTLYVCGTSGSAGWSLYATQTTDSAATLAVLSVVNASTGAAVDQSGTAWQVNVSAGVLHMAGTSGGTVWTIIGHVTLLGTLSQLAVSVEAAAAVSITGTPRTLSLRSAATTNATSLLCVVQTDVAVSIVAWTMVNAEVPPVLTLRSRQGVAAAVDLSRDVHTQYIWASGLLLLFQTSSTGAVLRPFTGYGVTAVYPAVIENAGQTPVIITGIFFHAKMECVFGTKRVHAQLLNATALRCTPPAYWGEEFCTPLAAEVRLPNALLNITTANGVLLRRSRMPKLTSVNAIASRGPFTSTLSAAPIVVYGIGFTNTSLLRCGFMSVLYNYKAPARYISSRQVNCAFPVGLSETVLASIVEVTVSADDFFFSDPHSFFFVGEAVRLDTMASYAPTLEMSATYVSLPTVDIFVADASRHPLRDLDRNSTTGEPIERVVRMSARWVNSTRKGIASPIDPTSSIVVLSFTNKTVQGVTSFSIFLQYPLVSVGQLEFSAEGLEPVTMTYMVDVGEPLTMVIAVQPSPRLSSHSPEACRQPIVVFKDVSGNIVSDPDVLDRMTRGVVTVTYFNGVVWTTEMSQPVSLRGYYKFTNVTPRGLFGYQYQMTFLAAGFAPVSSDVMSMSPCYPDEYGRYDTTSCLPCPPHAVCNGSFVFNASDGFWKGGELSYDIYACQRPRVCQAGECTTGYTGILCGVCADGYGKTNTLCVRCFSLAANVVLAVLLTLFIIAVPLFLVIVTFQVFGPAFNVVHGTWAMVVLLQLVGLVVLPMPELPDYVSIFVAITQLVSTGNTFILSSQDCLFSGLTAEVRFVVQVALVGIVFVVLSVVLLYGDVLIARRSEALQKRRWFLRLLAPFPSEEAYHSRLAELGLDEERALNGAVTVETLDSKQRTIREAYALIDNNRYAISAVSQLPSSAVRESALISLLEEQTELLRFLRAYEAHVSRGGAAPPTHDGGNNAGQPLPVAHTAAAAAVKARRNISWKAEGGVRAAEEPADLAAPPAASPAAPGVDAPSGLDTPPRVDGSDATATDGETASSPKALSHPPSGTHSSLGASPAPPPPSPPPSTATARTGDGTESVGAGVAGSGGGLEMQEAVKAEGRRSPHDTAAAVLQNRLAGITPTPFTLFGAHTPFRPTPTPLLYLHPQVLPATEQVAPQRQAADTASAFLWPSFRVQAILLCFVVYHYFYISVVDYSFALVRCDTVTMEAPYSKVELADPTPRMESQRTLAADRRVDCSTKSYAAYRVAGIVVGSLYGAALPLGLLWLSLRCPRNTGGRVTGLAYVRDCFVALLGVGDDFLWWEACALLYRTALILIRNLVSSSNVAGLLICWTLMAYFGLLVYLQPFYGVFPQSLQVISFFVLTMVSMIQLLPLFNFATMESGMSGVSAKLLPVQQACGALVVALPCLAFVLLLFLLWAVAVSRQPWRRLGRALFALGGGVEVHNILHFWHKQRAEGRATPPQPSDRVAHFSFAGYNMRFVRLARPTELNDDTDERNSGGTTLADQIVQAVRGKLSSKLTRRGGSSLWVSWGLVGGLIGMANHVHLLSRFIAENEGAVPGDAVMAAATGAEREGGTRADAAEESVVQSMAVMDTEAEEELLTMREHLRQLEHYVLQMEKALERRTES